MKKFLSVLIVIVMSLTLGIALVACTPNKTITYKEAFDKIGEALPGETNGNITNITFEVPKEDGSKDAYTLSIGSKFSSNVQDEQLGLRILRGNYTAENSIKVDEKDVMFAIYVANKKMFMQTQSFKICLEDIPAEYLLTLIKIMPDLDGLISLVGGLLQMDLSLDSVMELLFTMIQYEATSTVKGNTETIDMKISLSGLMEAVLPLLEGLNLDATIKSALESAGMRLPESDVSIDALIMEIVNMIPIGDLVVKANLVENKLQTLDVDYKVKDGNGNENVIIETTTTMLSSEENDFSIGVPEDIANYVSFSFTNIAFDIDLKVQADTFDVGQMINLILGYNEFEKGLLVLDTKNTNFRLSVKTDLDLADNQKNVAAIELFRITGDHATIGEPLLGIYYVGGLIKLNISNLVPGLKVPNIVVKGLDITKTIQDGFNMIKDLILGLIGGKSPAELNQAVSEVSSDESGVGLLANSIIPISVNGEDSSIVTKIGGLFFSALKYFGLDQVDFFEVVQDDNGRPTGLKLKAGKDLYDLLDSWLINQDATLVPKAVRPLEAELYFDWTSGGLDSVAVNGNYDLNRLENSGSSNVINVNLSARNFQIGYAYKDTVYANLADYVLARTNDDDYEYSESLKDLIDSALDGVKVQARTDITLKKGTYNISELLSGLGVQIPGIQFKLDNDMKISTEFRVLIDYNSANPKTSKLAIELKLLPGSNFPFGTPGKNLIGLYVENGVTYLDISNLKIANLHLPKVKVDIDFMSMFANLVDSIDVNFTVDELIKLITGASGETNSNDSGAMTVANTTRDGINIDLDLEDKLQITATSLAIKKLLSTFSLDFDLPTFDIGLSAGGDTIVKFDFNLYESDNPQNIKATINAEVTDFIIGEELDPKEFDYTINPEEYESRVDIMIKELLYNIDLSFDFSIVSGNTNINLTNLVNNILAQFNQRIDLPINLNMDNLNEIFTMNLKWNIDEDNHNNTQILFEIYSKDFGNYIYGDAKDKKGFFIGLYYKDNTLYINLSQLGILNVKIPGIDLTKNIVDLIDGIEGLEGLDLTDIIGGLLPKQSNNLLANAAMSATANEVLNNADSFDTNSLIEAILNHLIISDSGILLDFISEIAGEAGGDRLKDLLHTFGIDLGYDVEGQLLVDFIEGKVNVDVNIDDAEMGLGLNINNIGNKVPVDFKNHSNKGLLADSDYSVWSGATIADIIMNLFSSLSTNDISANEQHGSKPIAAIDLFNMNNFTLDNEGNKANQRNSYLDIRKATRDFSDADKRAHNLEAHTALQGDYVIRLYMVNADATSKTCLAVIVASPKRNNIYIQATEGLFSVNYVFGTLTGRILKFEIPFDLRGILEGIPGFTTPLNSDGTVSATYANGDSSTSGMNILDMITRVNISLRNDASININADLNAKPLNDFLVTTLDNLFMNLEVEDIKANARYKQAVENPSSYRGDWGGTPFMEDLFSNLIKPLAEQMTGLAIGGLVGIISDQYFDAIARLLPLAEFSTMNVQANIVNGAIYNARIETWDDPNVSNQQKLKLNISNATQLDEINWNGLGNTVVYNPLSETDLVDRLNGYKAVKFGIDAHNDGKRVTQSITYSNIKEVGGQKRTFNNLGELKSAGYPSGTYSMDATAHGVTKTVTLVINNSYGNINDKWKLDTIVVPAFSDMPTQVWATTEGGERVLIKNVKVSEPASMNDLEIENGVRVYKDATVTTINGYTFKNVRVEFLPDGVEYGSISLDAYDRGTDKNYSLVLPEFITVYVKEGGYYRTLKVSEWQYDEMTKLSVDDWKNGATVKVTAVVNKDKYNEKTYDFNVVIEDSNINGVYFDTVSKDIIDVDPYEYYKYQAYLKAVGTPEVPGEYPNAPKVENPYPNMANITFGKDGSVVRSDDFDITWDTNDLNKVGYNVQGGSFKNITININPNNVNKYDWSTREITVRVLSRELKAVIFGVDSEGNYITTQKVNPFNSSPEELDRLFPKTMDVMFAQNDILRMDVEWDLSSLDNVLNIGGGNVMVKATVKPSYKVGDVELLDSNIISKLTSSVYVPVEVENKSITGVYEEDATYTINNIGAYLFGDVENLADLLPKSLRYTTSTGEVLTLPTTYDLQGFMPSVNGGKATIKAKISCGEQVLSFNYDIIVPNRLNPKLNDNNTFTLEYYDYLVNGDASFGSNIEVTFDGGVESVPVTWNISNVNFLIGNGYAMLYIGNSSTKAKYSIKVNVVVNNAPNLPIDTMPMSVSYGYDTFHVDKARFDELALAGREKEIFDEVTSWKLSYMDNDYTEVNDIEWVIGELDSSKNDQTVKLIVYKAGHKGDIKNALIAYDIKVVFN